MFFSKGSLYGWGVCKVPMPRTAADVFNERRYHPGKIDFQERREGDRPPNPLFCLGSIIRDDLPWRQLVWVAGLALFFLTGISWIASILPAEAPQPEPLPIEIVVQMKKALTPIALPEVVSIPTPTVTAAVQLPEKKVLEIPPARQPVLPPVVKPIPKQLDKLVKKTPEKVIVKRVIEQPKKEILLIPPNPVHKSYRPPQKSVEKAPEKQVTLNQTQQKELLSVPPPQIKKHIDQPLRTDSLPVKNDISLSTVEKESIALQGTVVKRRSNESVQNANVLPQNDPISLKQKNVTVKKTQTAFHGYADDNRPNRETVPFNVRSPLALPKTATTNVARVSSPRRAFDERKNSDDLLGATKSTAVFAAKKRQSVEITDASPKAPRRETPNVSTAGGLPSGKQVFRGGSSSQEEIVIAQVEVGTVGLNDRPVLEAATSGEAAFTFDENDLSSIDSSKFISLRKMQPCLDPGQEGRLRSKLAVLLQKEGRCTNGQVVFDVKSPQDGYSVHLQLYNPAEVSFVDRCVVLDQAIDCFVNFK